VAGALTDGAEPTIERARDLAREAWDVVGIDVRRARALASEALATSPDPEARSVANRALGMAAIELDDVDACERLMRQALHDARTVGDPVLLAQAEVGAAAAAQYRGDRRTALTWARRASRRAPEQARVALSLGLILERFGEMDEALAAYGRAEVLAHDADDRHTLVRLWCNRGILHTYRSRFVDAERDLDAAARLADDLGLDHLGWGVAANQAFLASRRGLLVDALARFDALTPAIEALGPMRLGGHELDRCETLLLAGLSADAMEAASSAIVAFEQAGLAGEAAEARTADAQASLVAGEVERARAQADRALQVLRRRGPGPWSALAEEVAARADWVEGRRDAQLARRTERVAAQLEAEGMPAAGAGARILAARIELALGRRARAEQQLRLVKDTPRSPVGVRIQGRCAAALLRRQTGDRRGARAALRAGWLLLERHRETLGATELRAGATAHVAEVVAIGLEMAIEDRRPREVMAWAERGRSGALAPRATAPPDDPDLAGLLAELRLVAGEADAAAKRGDDSVALLRRQAAIEQRVRARARLLPPSVRDSAPPDVAHAELVAHLGDRALIEFVISGGDVWAVVAVAGRFSLRRVCTEPQVADEVDGLRVALRRLAFGSPVPQLRAAARDAADYARARLTQLLFDPLADLVGDRARVVVPMGILHAVPWSALAPGTQPHVVAPSAALWVRASAGAASATARGVDGHPRSPLLVAGPRLAEADAEVASISAHAPGATLLTGEHATVDAVRDAMAGASLAHLACHGRFRADNPLFSSLELHDGALSVFELERLGRAPQRIILSACDAGLSAVHPGDELLGLAAALLRLGTTGIVASVLPVPDAATRRLMEGLHEELAAGKGLADALAAARTRLNPERDDDLVASYAFQVLGAG
jgi:tetratricopeptide (TPR) repeat protein